MFLLATSWTTISSFVTGAGTLVLAVATFAAVRSANRSARIAELALQEQRRPLLAPSRLEDQLQKLMFMDGYWISAAGGRAAAEHVDGSVYLGISLRNVGSGIGVCQGWTIRPEFSTSGKRPRRPRLRSFDCKRATSTSRPATSACGRAHCATLTILCAPPLRRRSTRASR